MRMMGRWLARLKNEKVPAPHATKPTKPPQGVVGTGYVGFVAYPPTLFQKIEVVDSVTVTPEATAANDAPAPATEPAIDPDRWCWPQSSALNSTEIDLFLSRLARFTEKGASYDVAERMAEKLVIRDREGDDRRLCLECSHLQGSWRCGNHVRAGVGRDLPFELVLMLQRCPGLQGARPRPAVNNPVDPHCLPG
jgi:hypothetical protein